MRISPTNKPRVFVTMGDPAGVGPEVVAKALKNPRLRKLAAYLVIGDSPVIENAFSKYGVKFARGSVEMLDPGPSIKPVLPGKPTEESARKTLDSLALAAKLLREDENTCKALVTAPVNKRVIAQISPGFVGHTEYLQNFFSAKTITMVLIGKKLCVVPVTRHIPIKEVAPALNIDMIFGSLCQVAEYREVICGDKKAVIGVAALNPHSGEGGSMGREEIDIITPAVEKARIVYPRIEGPISADAIFYKALKKDIDIVVSMYHDQCLAPFKMVDFDNGVNMTLGLGRIRTSPDHGTAYDIAGKGIASPKSMERAIELAVRGARMVSDI